MKSKFIYRKVYLCVTAVVLLFSTDLSAQAVLRGGIKSNFGVDGDAESDTARNGGAFSPGSAGLGSDDWFKFINKLNATGISIIDTVGASVIKANMTANPGEISYIKRLNVPQHSIVNGKMLIDALYGIDKSGNGSDNMFGPGGSVLAGPSSWSLDSGNATGKSDILDFASHIRRDGAKYTDSLWMFLGMSFASTNGTKEGSMELFVNNVEYNGTIFTGYGNEEGRVAWRFNSAGEVIVPGDLAITFSYAPNSGVFTVDPMIWVADSNRNIGNPAYRTPINFSYSTGANAWNPNIVYGYQRITPISGNSFAYANASANSSKAPPFGTLNTSGNISTTFGNDQNVELGMNLTALGVDPTNFAAINQNPCGVAFRTIIYRTTTSGTFNGAQKDIAGPYPFWRSVVSANKSRDTFDCVHTSQTFNLPKVGNTIFYNWSTLPGTTQLGTLNPDSSMTFTEPGSYLLEYSTEDCVNYADTIIILQDTTHPVATVTMSDTLIEGSVLSVVIYGGSVAQTVARMNTNSAIFGPSQGLIWNWTGVNNFSSNIQFPNTTDSGKYYLEITELRNGCKDKDSGILVMLPVEYGPFHCALTPEGVQLNWETYSERNSSHFFVQKWNGLNYENIGRIEAQGESVSIVNYIFVDKKPSPGPNIYRVGMNSFGSEKMSYTEPCITNISGQNENIPFVFSVYPNPGKGEFTVVSALHAESNTTVFLYDLSGRVLKSEILEFDVSGVSKIDLTGMLEGVYLLGIADGQFPQTAKLTIK